MRNQNVLENKSVHLQAALNVPLKKLLNPTALTCPCGPAADLPQVPGLFNPAYFGINEQKSARGKANPETPQVAMVARITGTPDRSENIHLLLAPTSGFRAIKLMTSADGWSEPNGYQSSTQFELEYLVHLPFAADRAAHLSAFVPVLLRTSTLRFPSKDFPGTYRRSVRFIFQTTPHLLDWDEIETLRS